MQHYGLCKVVKKHLILQYNGEPHSLTELSLIVAKKQSNVETFVTGAAETCPQQAMSDHFEQNNGAVKHLFE